MYRFYDADSDNKNKSAYRIVSAKHANNDNTLEYCLLSDSDRNVSDMKYISGVVVKRVKGSGNEPKFV